MEDLRYPIGEFKYDEEIRDHQLDLKIKQIEDAPKNLRIAVDGLSEKQLDTPYRPEGWTLRQVVHHLADSHMNGFIRFKWALTEDSPTIKAYDEKRWAELSDSFEDIQVSLSLFDVLIKKWVLLLKSLSPEDLEKKFIHPDSGLVSLRRNIHLYAWHGDHHIAHITSLKKRMGWE
ncbi:YfiT family bacillithiol transferase [Chengkuizengella marina]|uniref:Putative metal-dependent hydrolase ERL59_16480 n=1 Tax=Chengkuizengella marina TaxID=2507566 RepID=A0A6N9Q6S6_9BACL|nr:bacillithiol transferase BstA [Chengkuizengella marina]NBI30547.1 putative metal-dependent hydrolase [Chengkuizengella marina]